jgi:hypothetical protein
MKNLIVLPTLTILAGCAVSATMTVSDFYERFPVATETQYMTTVEAGEAVRTGDCIVLASHEYLATSGMVATMDLKNGAEGVDAIIENDGGNAYRISDHSWVPRLLIVFDTLQCSAPRGFVAEITH